MAWQWRKIDPARMDLPSLIAELNRRLRLLEYEVRPPPYLTVTDNVALDSGHSRIWVDATSRDVTVTLPDAKDAVREYCIVKIDSSFNTVAVTDADAFSLTLDEEDESTCVASDGVMWQQITGGGSEMQTLILQRIEEALNLLYHQMERLIEQMAQVSDHMPEPRGDD